MWFYDNKYAAKDFASCLKKWILYRTTVQDDDQKDDTLLCYSFWDAVTNLYDKLNAGQAYASVRCNIDNPDLLDTVSGFYE